MIRARNHQHPVSSSAFSPDSDNNDDDDDGIRGNPDRYHLNRLAILKRRRKNCICGRKFIVVLIVSSAILFWRLSLLSIISENNSNNIVISSSTTTGNNNITQKTTILQASSQLPPPPSEDTTTTDYYYDTVSFRPVGKIDTNVTIISKKKKTSSSSSGGAYNYYDCRNNAIVLLGQKKRHSTYNRNSYGLLVKSLQLISENYITRQNHYDNLDVFIFHTGDFDYRDIDYLESLILGGGGNNNTNSSSSSSRKGILKLVNLNSTVYWSLPPWHQRDNQQHWKSFDIFPVGYRHMCRFFAIKIWHFFEELNLHIQNCSYRYILRIDEDSFILSPIDYDIFDYMLQHNFVYGYRMCAYEMDYNAKIAPWLKKWKSKTSGLVVRDVTHDMCGFYNNFFIADIQFFTTNTNVKSYLSQIHRQGFIYRKRYGDLLIHTTAVYSFAQPNQIHRFLDFTYQHVTIDHILHPQQGCVVWGAIQAGYNDMNAETILDKYMEEYVTSKHCTANVTYMDIEDLSPTYQHDLRNDNNIKIRLKTIAAGRVELPGKVDFSLRRGSKAEAFTFFEVMYNTEYRATASDLIKADRSLISRTSVFDPCPQRISWSTSIEITKMVCDEIRVILSGSNEGIAISFQAC